MIAFEDNGKLLISSKLNPVVLEAQSTPSARNVGHFAPREQGVFLDYHRHKVFKG
jgi:hypothetical protein